jgi:hypothetical protein
MIDLVNENILPSREVDLPHSRYQALFGISKAIAVQQ